MLTDLSFTDIFCRTILFTAQKSFFIVLILFGFVFLRKPAFGRAFFILIFVIILNRFLKELFQFPLPPGVSDTNWAFPSGHMITTTTFWLWLAWEYKNKVLSIFTVLLLSAVGFALVHCGYHYPFDIAGAVFFSIITLVLYYFLVKIPYLQKNPPVIGFILAVIAIPFMIFTDKALKHLSIWLALGALLGFACGWFINNKFCGKASTMNLKLKSLIFVLCLIGIFGLQYLFGLIQTKNFITIGIQYFTIALWLSAIPQCIVCVLFRKNISSLSEAEKNDKYGK